MNKRKNIEAQLLELTNIQVIDTLYDRLMQLQGELPMEIKDLEDEIEGLKTRLENMKEREKEIQQQIRLLQGRIENAKRLIDKYEKQKLSVRNNREYLALEKEIEMQQLEIAEAEKEIAKLTEELEGSEEVEGIQAQMEKVQEEIEDKSKLLEARKKELDEILAETGRELEELEALREKYWEAMDERLRRAYLRIRNNFMNRMAVVTIERDACGGCHSQVPPQRQLDIARRQKIIVCENCGRILIDPDLMETARNQIKKLVKVESIFEEESEE